MAAADPAALAQAQAAADAAAAAAVAAQAEADAAAAEAAAVPGSRDDPLPETDLLAFVIRDPALSTTSINVPDPNLFLQTTGGDHYTIGGTAGDDTIIGGIGDDSIWGREGNDRLEGGDGADLIEGGPGDDIITDLGGPDVIEGGAGNDAIHSGNEEDVIFGDSGNDFIVNPSELGEIFGGEGDDFIFDGEHLGHTRGGDGDDWLENLGGGEDLFQGDNGVLVDAGGEPPTKGHDVFVGRGGNNDADMESGDDIIVDGPGIDRVEGQLGFDWVSFQNDLLGIDVDLDFTIFLRPILPPSNASILNRYDRIEGISGSPFGDILNGTANTAVSLLGNELEVANMGLIDGLAVMIPESTLVQLPNDPVTGEARGLGWTGGEIILGGGGSDLLNGEEGDDILDGDSALDVGLAVAGETTIYASMADLQARVFDGSLPVGDISISRSINNGGSAGDVDTALYAGDSAGYVIEGVAMTGVPSDEDGDGYIRVTDQDTVAGEGSDLLRNIERIRFQDGTVSVGGDAAVGNSLATGQPEIVGVTEVGGTLTATLGTVVDTDGFDSTSISWNWESELEAGVTGFAPIMREGTFADAIEVTGQSMVVSVAEAGLRVRVVGTFKDRLGVFEVVRSAPVSIGLPAGVLPPGLELPPVANFSGTAADLAAAPVVVDNVSRVGRPRLDVRVTGVPLASFPNNNFGTPVVAEDGIAVGNIALTFANAAGETGSFAAEIVAVSDEAGVVDQLNVDIVFSIRGNEVGPLVVGPTTATLTLDGAVFGVIDLSGDSRVNDAIGVTFGLVDMGVPAVAVTPDPPAATGVVSGRGRVRVSGTCENGTVASADADLNCRTRASGRFRCSGRGLAPGQEVNVSCN